MQDWGVDSIPLHGRVGQVRLPQRLCCIWILRLTRRLRNDQPAELGESYVYLATSNLSTGTIVHPNSFVLIFDLCRLRD